MHVSLLQRNQYLVPSHLRHHQPPSSSGWGFAYIVHLIGMNGMLKAIAHAITALGDHYLVKMISGNQAVATGTVCRRQRTQISCPRPLLYPHDSSSSKLTPRSICSVSCDQSH